MKSRSCIILIAALSGCGGARTPGEFADSTSASVTLPKTMFELSCRAAKGDVPYFAKQDFRIRVNPMARTYVFSHWSSDMPIKDIRSERIVLRQDLIEKGRDNNPESWRITYDLRSKKLDYHESFSALTHEDWAFSTQCEIV